MPFGEGFASGVAGLGLGGAAAAYGLNAGISAPDEKAIRDFGDLANANIPDPQQFQDQYITRGSRAAATHPWGLPLPTLMSLTHPASMQAPGKNHTAFEHYDAFAKGPLDASLQVGKEMGQGPQTQAALDKYLAAQKVPDFHQLPRAEQEKLYAGLTPWLKAHDPTGYANQQHLLHLNNDVGSHNWMRQAAKIYNTEGVGLLDAIRKHSGKAVGIGAGVGLTALAAYAWLRHRRKQKEEAGHVSPHVANPSLA